MDEGRATTGADTGTPTPRSRRERPAKPALTRAGIVGAAMRIMREEGLRKVTMRRLAKELDTGPASLYVYVSNTAELHSAILDELLGELEPPAGDGPWDERLIGLLGSYTTLLFAHPSLAGFALVSRPSGPHSLALLEQLLALLDEGGVPPAQAAWGVDVLLQQATAVAAEQSARDQDIDAHDDWNAMTRAVREAPAATHPHVHALGSTLHSGAPHERLTWNFRTLINGILHTPTPESPIRAPGPGTGPRDH
ncbi:TetR/AcrR family transcriptional regulator [Streptomyces sp. NPDC049954]|uniref:TetR/AcrR family transcriptional regulator n=1 Tax=Streptomyces sp. NPDC049954 TaxID=3155779 RepID=UPI003441FC39